MTKGVGLSRDLGYPGCLHSCEVAPMFDYWMKDLTDITVHTNAVHDCMNPFEPRITYMSQRLTFIKKILFLDCR